MTADLTAINGRHVRPPAYPENTIQAIDWARKHYASIRFWPDGDVSVEVNGWVSYQDTLVTAVCEAIRAAHEKRVLRGVR
jgi:hypothetical protein